MYQETCDFPIFDEPQHIEWDGHPFIIRKTQIHISQWGNLILDIYIDGINRFPTDIPLYPIQKLPLIQAIFNGEKLFFQVNDFIPLPIDFAFTHPQCYKLSATVTPIIPHEKLSCAAKWEAFIPNAAIGSANGRGRTYLLSNADYSNESICFTLDKRKWELRSLIEQGEHLTVYEHCHTRTNPIQLSNKGMLLQIDAEDISQDDFITECNKICAVLEFAIGSPLAACIYSKRFSDGSRYPYLSYNTKSILHGKYGVLRSSGYERSIPYFMKNAYPIYLQNEKWWNITRHWYVHMICTNEVDAGNFYASLLFDRLYAYLSATDAKHNDWLYAHRELTQKRQGKKVIYEGKLTYLSERFNVHFNCKRFKDRRNELVHNGEPDFDYPNNIIQHYEAINLISTIILSLLKYYGDFKHRKRKQKD